MNYTDTSGCKPKSAREIQVDIANKSSSYNIMDVTMMQMANETASYDLIYGHNTNYMLSESKNYYTLRSYEDVDYFHRELSYGDYDKIYELTSVISFVDLSWVQYAFDLLNLPHNYTAATDSYGNVLYLEVGYSITQISRVYYWDRASYTENQYIAFNQEGQCVFNKTIQETYFSD